MFSIMMFVLVAIAIAMAVDTHRQRFMRKARSPASTPIYIEAIGAGGSGCTGEGDGSTIEAQDSWGRRLDKKDSTIDTEKKYDFEFDARKSRLGGEKVFYPGPGEGAIFINGKLEVGNYECISGSGYGDVSEYGLRPI